MPTDLPSLLKLLVPAPPTCTPHSQLHARIWNLGVGFGQGQQQPGRRLPAVCPPRHPGLRRPHASNPAAVLRDAARPQGAWAACIRRAAARPCRRALLLVAAAAVPWVSLPSQIPPCCCHSDQDKWVRLFTDVEPVVSATTALLPVFCLSLLGDNANVCLQALLRGSGKQKVRAAARGRGGGRACCTTACLLVRRRCMAQEVPPSWCLFLAAAHHCCQPHTQTMCRWGLSPT